MKIDKKKLSEISWNYIDELEQLLPEIEKEILWRIIDSGKEREHVIFFNRGKLIIDLLKSSNYKVCSSINRTPYYDSDRISIDVINEIGMPKYSTETSMKCKSMENYFIKSILEELLSGIRTGLDLLSILRRIGRLCSIDTYNIPEEDLRKDSRVVIKTVYCIESSSINDYFGVYYEVLGRDGLKSIRLSNFNSVGLAKKFIL